MKTIKIYEIIKGFNLNKFYLGEKTGYFINNGKLPGGFQEINGAFYPMMNYWFE